MQVRAYLQRFSNGAVCRRDEQARACRQHVGKVRYSAVLLAQSSETAAEGSRQLFLLVVLKLSGK